MGGNGRQRTAGYAIRYADELNYVFIEPDDIVERMSDVRALCEAEGRDPATLRFSLYERDDLMREAGPARIDRLAAIPYAGTRTRRHPLIALAAAPFFAAAAIRSWR